MICSSVSVPAGLCNSTCVVIEELRPWSIATFDRFAAPVVWARATGLHSDVETEIITSSTRNVRTEDFFIVPLSELILRAESAFGHRLHATLACDRAD